MADWNLIDPTGMGRPPRVGYALEEVTAADLPTPGQLTPLAAFFSKALSTGTPGLAPDRLFPKDRNRAAPGAPAGATTLPLEIPAAVRATTLPLKVPQTLALTPLPLEISPAQTAMRLGWRDKMQPEPEEPPDPMLTEPVEQAERARIVIGPNGVPLMTDSAAPGAAEWSPGSSADRKARADAWIASQRKANPPPPPPGPPDMSMAAVEGRIRAANQLNRLWGAEAGPRMAEQEMETGRLQERQKQDIARLTPEQRHAWELEKEVAAHPEGQIARNVAQLSDMITNDPATRDAFILRQQAELESASHPQGPSGYYAGLPQDQKQRLVNAYFVTNALNAYIANMLRANRARVDESQNPLGLRPPEIAMNAPMVQGKQ